MITTTHEDINFSPASAVRNYRSTVRWKGVTYIQIDNPRGSNWVQEATYSPVVPTDTELGNSIFVSSKGKKIANGAVRESITNHFSSLTEAVSAAQSGDTIYVYGGTYTGLGNLYKDGVNFEFHGYPTLASNSTLFSDNGIATANIFRVKGNARISSGGVFSFTGVNNTVDLEFDNITTSSSTAILFQDVVGQLKVQNKLRHASNLNFIVFRGNARVKIYADIIENATTNTNSNYGTIYCDVSTVPYFSGDVEVNANVITRNGGRAGIFRIGNNQPNLISGKVTINCPDINYTTSAAANQSNNAIAITSKANNDFELFVNGNITVGGNTNSVIYIFGAFNLLGYYNATFNGDIITTSPNAGDRVLFFDSYGGQATDVNITFKNGQAINNGAIQRMFVCEGGTDNVLTFDNYKIYNNYDSGAVTQTGISIAPTVDLRLNNVLIYTPNVLGAPYPIAATAPTNIRVYQGQVCTNIAPDPNITNLITGTSIIVDTDVI